MTFGYQKEVQLHTSLSTLVQTTYELKGDTKTKTKIFIDFRAFIWASEVTTDTKTPDITYPRHFVRGLGWRC